MHQQKTQRSRSVSAHRVVFYVLWLACSRELGKKKKNLFARNRQKKRVSDELGYASGDGQHQITVDFAFVTLGTEKYNLQSRAKRLSSSRESVHTYAKAL